MAFTDEQLEDLSRGIEESNDWEAFGLNCDLMPRHIEELIARLEAAERLSASYEKFDFDEDRELLKQEWRKATGKEGL